MQNWYNEFLYVLVYKKFSIQVCVPYLISLKKTWFQQSVKNIYLQYLVLTLWKCQYFLIYTVESPIFQYCVVVTLGKCQKCLIWSLKKMFPITWWHLSENVSIVWYELRKCGYCLVVTLGKCQYRLIRTLKRSVLFGDNSLKNSLLDLYTFWF